MAGTTRSTWASADLMERNLDRRVEFRCRCTRRNQRAHPRHRLEHVPARHERARCSTRRRLRTASGRRRPVQRPAFSLEHYGSTWVKLPAPSSRPSPAPSFLLPASCSGFLLPAPASGFRLRFRRTAWVLAQLTASSWSAVSHSFRASCWIAEQRSARARPCV